MKTIDGNALEKAVASYIYEDAKLSIPQLLKNGDLLMVCEIISHFPAIDATPIKTDGKRAEWLYGENRYGEDGYYCSECHRHVIWHYDDENIDFIYEYKFCPFCGSRMECNDSKIN